MKNILLILTLMSSWIATANELKKDKFIGDGYVSGVPIEVELNITGNTVDGVYRYTKYKKNIPLAGEIKNQQFLLKTKPESGFNEEFEGQLIYHVNESSFHAFSGKWKMKNKTADFAFYRIPQMEFEASKKELKIREIKNVSCADVEQYPYFFLSEELDLGSGHGSPINFDYRCEYSLASLDFVKPLLELAEDIRRQDHGRCSGSIVHAYYRYYHYRLMQYGYLPQKARRYAPPWDYFAQWGAKSVYNNKKYNEYKIKESQTVTELANWYQQNHKLDAVEAKEYAQHAINEISNRAFGSPAYSLAKPQLIEGWEELLTGMSATMLTKIQQADIENVKQTINALLVLGVSNEVLNAILESRQDISEGIIVANAVNNPENVNSLIQHGVDIHHKNEFGKTALYYAIQFNQHQSTALLIQYGANVNDHYDYKTPGHKWGCERRIQRLFRTPLMHAAQHSDVKMVELLLEHNASLNAKDSLGKNALWYAVNEWNYEVADFIASKMGIEVKTQKRVQLSDEQKEKIKSLHMKAYYAFSRSEYEASIEYLNQAYNLDENDRRIHAEFIKVYAKTNQAKKKQQHIDKLLAETHIQDIYTGIALYYKAQILKKEGKLEQAYKNMIRSHQLNPIPYIDDPLKKIQLEMHIASSGDEESDEIKEEILYPFYRNIENPNWQYKEGRSLQVCRDLEKHLDGLPNNKQLLLDNPFEKAGSPLKPVAVVPLNEEEMAKSLPLMANMEQQRLEKLKARGNKEVDVEKLLAKYKKRIVDAAETETPLLNKAELSFNEGKTIIPVLFYQYGLLEKNQTPDWFNVSSPYSGTVLTGESHLERGPGGMLLEYNNTLYTGWWNGYLDESNKLPTASFNLYELSARKNGTEDEGYKIRGDKVCSFEYKADFKL